MKIVIIILALVLTPVSVTTVHAKEQGKVTQPAAGSALRKAVLDGLRPSIEADIKQKVIFIVNKIRVSDDWAFVQAVAVQPDSKPIDYRETKYKEQVDQDMFDAATVYALLRKKDNKWEVLTFQIGPTDVCWAEWDKAPYNCPRKILPLGDN